MFGQEKGQFMILKQTTLCVKHGGGGAMVLGGMANDGTTHWCL